MSGMMRLRHELGGLAAALAMLAAWGGCTSAYALPEDFPLGQSGGAICRALADDEDPAVQRRGARGWAIYCLGYDAAFGHLYLFRRDEEAATAKDSAWAAALAKRANCGESKTASISTLSSVQVTSCRSLRSQLGYSVYRANSGRGLVVAEGFDSISSLVQQGLLVVTGEAEPPAAMASVAIGHGGGSIAGVAADAQSSTPEYLIHQAYLRNGAWQFDKSEANARLACLAKIPQVDQARCEITVAVALSDEGRFAEADKYFSKADKLIAAAGETLAPQDYQTLQAFALNTKAQHALNQRKLDDAKRLAEQAVSVLGKVDPSAVDIPVARGSAREGDVISAEMSVELNAGAILTGAATPVQRAQVLLAQDDYILGCVAIELGQFASARQKLQEAESRLAMSHLQQRWLQADIGSALSRVDLREGKQEQAIADASSAVDVLSLSSDYWASPHEARVYLARARAEAAAGRTDLALTDYKTAFELFRQARGVVGSSASLAEPYFKMLVARAPQEANRTEEFFQAAQSILGLATAQTANQMAARISLRDDATAANARALQELDRQITIKRNAQAREQETDSTAAKIIQEGAELAALQEQRRQLAEKLMADPRYGALAGASTVSVAQVQQVLRPDEVYVKTLLLPSSGFAIAIGKNSARIYSMPLSRNLASQAVNDLRKPMDAPPGARLEFDVGGASRLFTVIFGPAQDEVRHAHNLVYEPDGDLMNLPAGVLVTEQSSIAKFGAKLSEFQNTGHVQGNLYEGVAWLARSAEISLSLSASAFVNARTVVGSSNAPRLFAGFGGPNLRAISDPAQFVLSAENNGSQECQVFRAQLAAGLHPLPGSGKSVLDIGAQLGASPADLVVGDAFTTSSVISRSDLANYRLILFATHGLLPQANGNRCEAEPSLVTSDGLLDSAAILNLRLNADLVVLSACDTGGGGSTSSDRTGLKGSGEALGGLARDFIWAGSRGLIVSHWAVSASATQKLMSNLFRAGGATQADALRQAEIALMDDSLYDGHPLYWAAFSLVGDGAKTMPGARIAANGP